MNRRHQILLGVLVVAGLMLGVGAVATQRLIHDDDIEVSLDAVPAAVKATILAQAQGNAVREVEMETEDGATIYEAEVVIGGKEVDIRVAADGTLLGQEADDEEADDEEEGEGSEAQVALGDLPEAVRKTLNEVAAGAEIKEMELETEDGRTQYAIDAVIDGQTFDIEIAPDGRLLQKEPDENDDD